MQFIGTAMFTTKRLTNFLAPASIHPSIPSTYPTAIRQKIIKTAERECKYTPTITLLYL